MNNRQREKVRKLLDFHFQSSFKYKLNRKRLKQLEFIIQERSKALLE